MSANFPFQENLESFVGEKTDKEYWLKISSKDASSISPFDFNVKFNMNIRQSSTVDNNGNLINPTFRKEAVIISKYNDIKRIEVTDVIVPRFIPTSTIGLNFDGVNLVKKAEDLVSGTTTYICNCYPGIGQKLGSYVISASSVNYIKFTNPKDTIVLTDISNSSFFGDADTTTFRYKDAKIIDHITINNIPYPIVIINSNTIMLNNFKTSLPDQTKLIAANYFTNIIYNIGTSEPITVTKNTITITNISTSLFENIYASNILRIYDSSGNNIYFTVNNYLKINTNDVLFNGTALNPDTLPLTIINANIFSFGFGSRDLLDDRIFYLELDPFVPVKSSATNDQLDKMFGVLFPSTQNKEWLYLSGEPKESFLPRDVRKLDKITIRIYDSNGLALNDLYINRPGLLNPNYYNNMYTTVVIKVDEIDKVLTVKK